MAPNDREIGELSASVNHLIEQNERIIERLDRGARQFDGHDERLRALETRNKIDDARREQRERWASRIGGAVLLGAGAVGKLVWDNAHDLAVWALAKLG